MKHLDYEDELTAFLNETEEPVIVLFHADWCSPCQKFKPQFARSSNLNKDFVHVMVNVDKVGPDPIMEYGIRSVPTVAVFKGRDMVGSMKSRTAEALGKELASLDV